MILFNTSSPMVNILSNNKFTGQKTSLLLYGDSFT
jgi:hypothetical protein